MQVDSDSWYYLRRHTVLLAYSLLAREVRIRLDAICAIFVDRKSFVRFPVSPRLCLCTASRIRGPGKEVQCPTKGKGEGKMKQCTYGGRHTAKDNIKIDDLRGGGDCTDVSFTSAM